MTLPMWVPPWARRSPVAGETQRMERGSFYVSHHVVTTEPGKRRGVRDSVLKVDRHRCTFRTWLQRLDQGGWPRALEVVTIRFFYWNEELTRPQPSYMGQLMPRRLLEVLNSSGLERALEANALSRDRSAFEAFCDEWRAS